ncbi:NUDIX hydrolase N-terminal domain-containing protein [Aliiglaciecola sp. LCG003]|uniref:NUDIX hydrolase n=1 Tax=Aliiglaciecola sp. LCG003 TaxID=3053655 RepID=UPI0025723D66|nr:NUDIX hydrolase N-terminal domain-containing protein [Aliiglaciecola sp. LCG003]WJG07770.1 NUDIX hydrolase N-terminal domain-containing protein [Aliiglaciecola sp. LCG003]
MKASSLNQTLWLNRIKRLHAIAETGLAFSPEEFDQQRFREISLISREMLADLANLPIEPITDLVTPFHRRYVTPQIEVRGAVFQKNKILLVQEKSDLKWTLPGGYADVGLSAVENLKKEMLEEAGIAISQCQLIALRHKASGDYDLDIREFYKLIFLCETPQHVKPTPGMETCGADFFPLNHLPPLSTGRTIVRDINDAMQFHLGNTQQTLIE